MYMFTDRGTCQLQMYAIKLSNNIKQHKNFSQKTNKCEVF